MLKSLSLSQDADDPAIEAMLQEKSDALLFRYAGSIPTPENNKDPFLSSGCALNSIVLQVASRRSAQRENKAQATGAQYADLALAQLLRSIELQNEKPFSASLLTGITGIGWAVNNSIDPRMDGWGDEVLLIIDEQLTAAVLESRDPCLDAVNGLAGVAVYALSRAHVSRPTRDLWAAIESKIDDALTFWMHGSSASFANGFYGNLGCAHGVPGLINMAAMSCSKGLSSEKFARTTADALDHLWSKRIAHGGYFPSNTGGECPARLAWCYGALGLAAVYRNSTGLSKDSLQRFNTLCALSIEQYWGQDHGISDASLCHGSAGVALAARLFAKTPSIDSAIADSLERIAIHACQSCLDLEDTHLGKPVFYFRTKQGLRRAAGFLEGTPGIALSLVAMFEPGESNWIQLLGY